MIHCWVMQAISCKSWMVYLLICHFTFVNVNYNFLALMFLLPHLPSDGLDSCKRTPTHCRQKLRCRPTTKLSRSVRYVDEFDQMQQRKQTPLVSPTKTMSRLHRPTRPTQKTLLQRCRRASVHLFQRIRWTTMRLGRFCYGLS